MKAEVLVHSFIAGFLLLLAGGARSDAQSVNVWLTTHNQSAKLQQQVSVNFVPGPATTNVIFMDETQTYQQVEGFGASFTDSAAYLLNEVATPVSRTNAMNNLFTRAGSGIGVSFLRNPMGASDLTRFIYTYDDLAPGMTDTNLASFSIAHDQADIIPLMQQALQLNPQLKVMANPWSPPGWMKTNDGTIGGALLPGMYTPFANYFVKYIQAYQAAGIPIHYISLQNEPLYVPGDYPGMFMNAATQLVVLRDSLLPALATNHLATQVLIYDHNWDRPDYPAAILSDAAVLASSQVAGTAWHGYGGTPGVMLSLARQFPGKGNYETEHSGGTWVTDQVRDDFEEIIHVMRSWGKSYVKWSIVLDQNHGPNTGGCNSCNPLVTVNTVSGLVSYNIDYFTLGHFSKFILPGANRVFSSNAAGLISAAFMNNDGSKVLVVFNDSPSSRAFQVGWGAQHFDYSLPSLSGVTFTWSGAQSGSYAVNAADQIQASSFNSVSGLQTEPTTDTLGGYDVGYADSGEYALYKNVNFGAGITNVSARVASAGGPGTVEFRLDNPTGLLIGSVTIPNTGGWQTWTNVNGAVSGANGSHNLYVVFKGSSGVGNLNWFQFLPVNQAPVLTAIADQTVLAGRTLVVTNSATDSGLPYQTLSYSLASSPVGSGIGTNNGLFSWRPLVAQSPLTQVVAVVVSDNGVPSLTATQSFKVTVTRPVNPTLRAEMTNAQFGFWIEGDQGPDYVIQTSTNLAFWSPVITATSPSLPYFWSSNDFGLIPSRFYRVVLGP